MEILDNLPPKGELFGEIMIAILKEDKDLVTEGGSGSAGRKSVSVKDQMNEVIHTRS